MSSTDEWRVGDTRGPAARRNSVQPTRDEADAMTARTGLGNVMLSEGLGQERCDCICRKCPARAHLFRRKPSGGDRGWGCLVNRCRISDWEGEKPLGTDRGGGCTNCERDSSHRVVHLKTVKMAEALFYTCCCHCARGLGRGRLLATPRTGAHQAPLSMGSSGQGYWSGLPCPPPGRLPDSGIGPESPMSPASAGGFFTTEPPGKHTELIKYIQTH